MSEKRYQIFVSSTYSDLKEERLQLLYAILKLNYIPAGMEYFPAIDEEQLEFIKRIIDQSDYYVLLLGARYGSLDSEGISYTEREYDYAVAQGKKVIALIHKNPDDIALGKTDKSDELYHKFMAFRQKVIDAKRLIAFWTDTTNLVLNFQSSLIQTIQRYPAIGWMRGDSLANTETLHKIAMLELENQRLKEFIKNIGSTPVVADVKVEARSATAPEVFSETEIECVSLLINVIQGEICDLDFYQNPDIDTVRGLLAYYREKAVPWFVKMAKVCRVDLRITNPNSYMIKNMRGENYFITPDGATKQIEPTEELLEESPSNPELGLCFMSRQIPPEVDLNPHQSTLYTHHRYFVPQKDCDVVYRRVVFGENIPTPVTKEIKVHFRIKKFDIELKSLIILIRGLERKKKFNDAGVFEFVASVLEKEKEDGAASNVQKVLLVQEGEEGNAQP